MSRRPDETKPWELEAGDYAKYKGRVFVVPPDGVGPLDVSSWSNTWHDDGTLTVSPSINRHPVNGDAGWHGFLERGEWRQA